MVMISEELLADSVVDVPSLATAMMWRAELRDAFPRASNRTVLALYRARLTPDEVWAMSSKQLLALRGIGRVSVSELIGSE